MAITVLVTFAILGLHACSRESTGEQDFDRKQLRASLHEHISGNTFINNRDSWEVISAASESVNNSVQLFYKRTTIDSNQRASGKNQNQADYWNREHVWPQSYGLRGTLAARDLHNIVPVDRTVNTSRGNKLFDVTNQPHHECSGCRTNSTLWEPPDAAKGDVARILFYMDVRYDGYGDEPDLHLSDAPDKNRATFGRLSILFQWHCSDEVSAEERQRNDVVAKAQGNRNPFIDKPALAESLYAFDCTRL